MLISYSRSAHDQNVLARRAQWDQHGCRSSGRWDQWEEFRSTRAVGITPATPSEMVGVAAHRTLGVVEVGLWCGKNWRVAYP